MILTKGLIAKAALALLSAASVTTVGVVYKDQIVSALGFSKETKWDKGLLEFLDSGGDIQFEVKKSGTGGSEEEVSNPSTETFNATKNYFVRIKATKEDSGTEGTLTHTDSTKKADLQKLNGTGDGTAWTWECKIILNKEDNASGTDLKDDEKNIFKNFLTNIKTTGTEHKELKKKFIKKCSEVRTSEINKKLRDLGTLTTIDSSTISGQEANKIKAEKTFTMITGENSKLKIQEAEEFKNFFSISA